MRGVRQRAIEEQHHEGDYEVRASAFLYLAARSDLVLLQLDFFGISVDLRLIEACALQSQARHRIAYRAFECAD